MLYSCTHMATLGVKGLRGKERCWLVVAELMWIDRDWYRIGALDIVTAATYMLIVLNTVTSLEELLLKVPICQVNSRVY